VEVGVGRFEDKLRPKVVASPWRRDVLAIAVLAVLAATLLPGWIAEIGPLFGPVGPNAEAAYASNVAQYLDNIPGQMASFHLLLAMGFALALRCGALDRSIWAVAGAGGVVAARLLNAGVPVLAAFAAVAAAGAAWGVIQGLLVSRVNLPSVLVTAAGAIALTLVLGACAGPGPVAVVGEPFAALRNRLPPPPLLVGRMLFVAGVYALAMLALVIADAKAAQRGQTRPNRRRELAAALVVSAALAALGGACWLMDYPSAPVPSWPIGDLRIVAAALLAGAALMAGRGRTMLVGLLLPVALLTATVWRQKVPLTSWNGWSLASLVLVGVTIVAQMAIDNALSWRQHGRWLAATALALLVAGMALLAATGTIRDLRGRRIFLLVALAVWLAGLVALGVSRNRRRPQWSSDHGRRSMR
jgi:ribose transport system permease protein